jgi:cell division protein ZapA
VTREVPGLEVSILDRSFRIACTEEEEAGLRQAVDYLDRKMREIRDNGKIVGHERIAIMAALNIAHELLAVRVGGGFDIGELKRRMNSMAEAIDAAVSAQNELF